MAEAIDVADWFVVRANRERSEQYGEGITNLKLQKMLYFAQAAKLGLDNEELFSDEICAWEYGPVVEQVYHRFKDYRQRIITKPMANGYQSMDADTVSFLEDVWQLFGKYSAGKLVEITHSHDPWKNAFDGSRNSAIPKGAIREYYKNVFVRA